MKSIWAEWIARLRESYNPFVAKKQSPIVEHVLNAKELGAVDSVDQADAHDGSVQLEAKGQRIVFVGNCQVNMLAALCNAMQQEVVATGWELTPQFFSMLEQSRFDDDVWGGVQCIWVHPNERWLAWLQLQPDFFQARVRPLPTIDTLGFHPDCAYVYHKGKPVDSPIGAYNSALVLWGFLQDMSTHATRQLFNESVFRHLGYFDLQAVAIDHLVNKGRQCGMPMHRWLADWQESGVWMHSINHPKPHVLADVAMHCLKELGLQGILEARDVVLDELGQL